MLLLNGSIKNLLKRRKLANYFFKWIKKKMLVYMRFIGKKRGQFPGALIEPFLIF
jgi:hypothetical protein